MSNKTEKSAPVDEALEQFYSSIEKSSAESAKLNEPQKVDLSSTDPTWNSHEQINRLLKPGSGYLNLNPFEVLKIPYDAKLEVIKRNYKKLSILVHPDKNSDNSEAAQLAFEAVNRSYKQLMDNTERKKCLEVITEAKEQLSKSINEKRMRVKKETKVKGLPRIDEDEPEKYKKALRAVVCKLFIDLERLRVRDEMRSAEERKRKAEQRVADELAAEQKKEFEKNYEESRDSRVTNWQSFQKKKRKKMMWYDVLPALFLTAGPLCALPTIVYVMNKLWLGKGRVHRQNADNRDYYMLLRDRRITGHPYHSRGVEEIDEVPRVFKEYNVFTK